MKKAPFALFSWIKEQEEIDTLVAQRLDQLVTDIALLEQGFTHLIEAVRNVVEAQEELAARLVETADSPVDSGFPGAESTT